MTDILRDESLISQLTIPGTHDSCTSVEYLSGWKKFGQTVTIGVIAQAIMMTVPVAGLAAHTLNAVAYLAENSAICQVHNLEDQLIHGIRFFDVRVNKDMNIYHGVEQFEKLNYKKVIEIFESFLKKNPKEFIVMSLKQEDSETIDVQTGYYAEKALHAGLFYDTTNVPNVSMARGRIVLVRRFKANRDLGINIKTFATGNYLDVTSKDDDNLVRGVPYSVQDHYGASTDDKVALVKAYFELAEQNAALYDIDGGKYPLRMYFNFSSATNGIAKPLPVAQNVNPRLYAILKELNPQVTHRLGIVAMDYYNPNVVAKLILCNTRQSDTQNFHDKLLKTVGGISRVPIRLVNYERVFTSKPKKYLEDTRWHTSLNPHAFACTTSTGADAEWIFETDPKDIFKVYIKNSGFSKYLTYNGSKLDLTEDKNENSAWSFDTLLCKEDCFHLISSAFVPEGGGRYLDSNRDGEDAYLSNFNQEANLHTKWMAEEI